MSALIRVPKKLKLGMAVVVFTKPGTWITSRELEAGLRVGKWVKCIITADGNDGWFGIKAIGANQWEAICAKSNSFIIVRSVALADNKTVAYTNELAVARDKYRAKVLGQ